MRKQIAVGALIFAGVVPWGVAQAQRIEVKEKNVIEAPTTEPKATGRKEASKYFEPRSPAQVAAASGPRDRFLAIHIGSYLMGDAYVWGQRDQVSEVGMLNAGVTYRVGEWINAADFLMRFDISTFEVDDVKPVKLGVLFSAAFPDANSRFPLYFGGGIGPGFFFKQVRGESPLTLDYQLFAGIRFFDVFDSVGFFLETGLKNHFHLLSDGQFNGTFLTAGALFTF